MQITNPGGHIDQMLRQTRAHHVQLSVMADLKANMLITMAGVLITLILPRLQDVQFRWTAATLMLFCLLTVVLAGYASMPKLTLRRDPGSPSSPSFNLLFFADFGQLDYPDYEAAMEEMMNDPSQTYERQVREVYLLGQYLARGKYPFVRLAYIAFIAGLVSSVVVFMVTNWWLT